MYPFVIINKIFIENYLIINTFLYILLHLSFRTFPKPGCLLRENEIKVLAGLGCFHYPWTHDKCCEIQCITRILIIAYFTSGPLSGNLTSISDQYLSKICHNLITILYNKRSLLYSSLYILFNVYFISELKILKPPIQLASNVGYTGKSLTFNCNYR